MPLSVILDLHPILYPCLTIDCIGVAKVHDKIVFIEFMSKADVTNLTSHSLLLLGRAYDKPTYCIDIDDLPVRIIIYVS